MGGFAGSIVSAALWGASAAACTWHSLRLGESGLILVGFFVFPLTQLLLRGMGHAYALPKGHPMNALGMQVAFTLPLTLPLVIGLAEFHPAWFYPALMIVLGGSLSSVYFYVRYVAIWGSCRSVDREWRCHWDVPAYACESWSVAYCGSPFCVRVCGALGCAGGCGRFLSSFSSAPLRSDSDAFYIPIQSSRETITKMICDLSSLTTILHGRDSSHPAKNLCEMTLVGEASSNACSCDVKFRITKISLCTFDSALQDILIGGHSCAGLE